MSGFLPWIYCLCKSDHIIRRCRCHIFPTLFISAMNVEEMCQTHGTHFNPGLEVQTCLELKGTLFHSQLQKWRQKTPEIVDFQPDFLLAAAWSDFFPPEESVPRWSSYLLFIETLYLQTAQRLTLINIPDKHISVHSGLKFTEHLPHK